MIKCDEEYLFFTKSFRQNFIKKSTYFSKKDRHLFKEMYKDFFFLFFKQVKMDRYNEQCEGGGKRGPKGKQTLGPCINTLLINHLG